METILGWGSPVGLAIFFIGLAALFWGLGKGGPWSWGRP